MTNKTESCFGNFNGQLEKCICCNVAVECHEESRVKEDTPTIQERLKIALTTKRLLKIHEYYMANPGCTMKQASLFTDLPISAVTKYMKIRKECLSVISAVIDVRYNTEMPCAEIRVLEVVQDV